MPTEMKNRLVKMSLKGRMPSSALKLYWDSAMNRPARNAPSARERPICAVASAMERHMAKVASRNISRLRVRAMTPNTLGIRKRAATISRINRPNLMPNVRSRS